MKDSLQALHSLWKQSLMEVCISGCSSRCCLKIAFSGSPCQVLEQYLQETRLGLNIHTVGLQKRDPFSIIEGEEDFGATFGVKTVQFTWQTVAFFCYG